MKHQDPLLYYYELELRYLRDAAKEFAQGYPEQAAQLGLNRTGKADPAVEQLFQGHALMMARLRLKLDDDFPELTRDLMGMLGPFALQMIPSMSIIEFMPDRQALSQSEEIAALQEISSDPVGDENIACTFRTTWPVTLHPITLSQVSAARDPDGRPLIRLTFTCHPETNWKQTDLRTLSLYIQGDPLLIGTLQMALVEARKMMIRHANQPDRDILNAEFILPSLAKSPSLWPQTPLLVEAPLAPYQFLLEYFSFEPAFHFVELHGLDTSQFPAGLTHFTLDIFTETHWPYDLTLSKDNLRLYCVPAINLFTLDAEPLVIQPHTHAYRLNTGRFLQSRHTQLYAVNSVTPSVRSEETFTPFTHFQHKGGLLRRHIPERYYHTYIQRGATGPEAWLLLGGAGFDADLAQLNQPEAKTQYLFLNLTGTNGDLPCTALSKPLLTKIDYTGQVAIRVHNVCDPTLPSYPPQQDQFHWRLLSHIQSNFLHLLDNPDVLKETLSLYHWNRQPATQRKIDAILAVSHWELERFEQGRLVRGIDIWVTLSADGFYGEGDIWLFAHILNHFFALYADIHLFNRLTLVIEPSGQQWRFEENHSCRLPG